MFLEKTALKVCCAIYFQEVCAKQMQLDFASGLL
jgi:hypothetical protein